MYGLEVFIERHVPLLCQNKHVPVINRISNIGILKISFLGPSTTAKGRPFVNPLARHKNQELLHKIQ